MQLERRFNKVVAPCFGRGEYRKILGDAHYYQNIEDVYDDLVNSANRAANEYTSFAMGMDSQSAVHEQMKKTSMQKNKDLKNLYDSI